MIRRFILYLLISIFWLFPSVPQLFAQTAEEPQEVYLTFRYQNIFEIYVIAYYRDGEFYLPHNELFRSLNLDVNVDLADNAIFGQYQDLGQYEIHFDQLNAVLADREIELSADDFLVREIDFYLRPHVFRELFDLHFNVDFNNLRLHLESEHTLPIVEQRDRERRRQRALRTQPNLYRDYYTLRYDRNRHNFNGGFLDYNLSSNFVEGTNSYIYSTSLGTELLGGDLQGNLLGSWSQTASSFRSNNLRWRYGIRDREWISQVIAGQAISNGLVQTRFSGLQITNEPIEPRYMYDDYVFTGSTTPQAEVELYRNNALVDFQQADELGNYRFRVPLTYGTSQYQLRIFSPTGQVSQQKTRLQIPYNLVPPGELNYTLEAGRLDNAIPGRTDRGMMALGAARQGLTNWLTARAGLEYYENYHDNLPTFSSALSGRFFTNYLLTLEAASEAFYRINAGAIYPSSASFDLSYTHYNRQGGVYNPGRNLSTMQAIVFTPFEIGDFPLYLRWRFNRDHRQNSEIFRYDVNVNTRIGRTNIRIGYRDTQIDRFTLDPTPFSRLTATASYNIPRLQNINSILRGAFLRTGINYAPSLQQFEDFEVQFSQNILQRGRIQLTGGRNFLGNFNYFSLNFVFDFNSIRSTTVTRISRNRSSISQSVRGSVGYDSGNDRFILNNRHQVGRSALAVRMFVDNNNSGTFEDGDQLIGQNAIRIEQAGSAVHTENGITYLSQLQPYRRYNLTVNKSAIRNPLLVPEFERFSLVTDPNQYKILDIPLYMSGVIEGVVTRGEGDAVSGIAGLRLVLEQVDQESNREELFRQEIRTFSDGSFYSYEVPPGRYRLQVDPEQLQLLNVVSHPESIEFEIEALAEGDFKDKLNFRLTVDESDLSIPAEEPEEVTDQPAIPDDLSDHSERFIRLVPSDCTYSTQFGSYRGLSLTMLIAEETMQKFGQNVTVYYNNNTDLYALYTGRSESFSAAIEDLEQLQSEDPYHQYAVISECSDSDFSLVIRPLRYIIRLSEFQNPENAREFAQIIRDRAELETEIQQFETEGNHVIFTGPYDTGKTAFGVLEQLSKLELPVEPYIARYPESHNDINYFFRIYTHIQTDPDSIESLLNECENISGYSCSVAIDEVNLHHIFVDRHFNSWFRFMDYFNKLNSEHPVLDPAIQLIIQ